MEKDIGYIKVFRRILSNEFLMKDDKAFNTFVKILLQADHKTGKLKTGRKKLAKLTRLNENTVYKVIKRLERENMIEINSSKSDTVITICNWEKWQKGSKKDVDLGNNPGNNLGNNPGNNLGNNPENYKNEKGNNLGNKNGTSGGFNEEHYTRKERIYKNNNVPTFEEVERPSKKKYEDIDVRLTEKFFKLMKQNYDHITKNPKEADYIEIRRINSIDGKSYEAIEWIIEWSQRHEFWKDKILSTGKLRKQMDQLMVQAKDEQKKKSTNYKIPGSSSTKKNDPMIKEKELSPEQKERGKLMKDLMAAGYKMSEVVNLRSKSNEELKKLLGDKIK